MGRRRRSAKKVNVVRKQALATTFTCPFCLTEKSITCKMDRTKNIGYLSCRVCLANFQSRITYLSEPVDVYSEWVDACEVVNNGEAGEQEEEAGVEVEYTRKEPSSASAGASASGSASGGGGGGGGVSNSGSGASATGGGSGGGGGDSRGGSDGQQKAAASRGNFDSDSEGDDDLFD